jgi:hypothetical protein
VDWVRGQRYIEDGKRLTTAGVTSGVFGAPAAGRAADRPATDHPRRGLPQTDRLRRTRLRWNQSQQDKKTLGLGAPIFDTCRALTATIGSKAVGAVANGYPAVNIAQGAAAQSGLKFTVNASRSVSFRRHSVSSLLPRARSAGVNGDGTTRGDPMGRIRKTLFAALAAAAIEQARKPENQRRIRELIEQARKPENQQRVREFIESRRSSKAGGATTGK